MIGTAPAAPAIRLAAAPPDSEPCTSRKSIARCSRQATRCSVIDSPFTWMEMMMPRKRKAGRSVQKSTLKSNPNPGQKDGNPTHAERATRLAS